MTGPEASLPDAPYVHRVSVAFQDFHPKIEQTLMPAELREAPKSETGFAFILKFFIDDQTARGISFIGDGVAVVLLVPALDQRAIIRTVVLAGVAITWVCIFYCGETKVSVILIGDVLAGTFSALFFGRDQAWMDEEKNRRQSN